MLVQNHDHIDILLRVGGHGSNIFTVSRSLTLKFLALLLGSPFSLSEFNGFYQILAGNLLLGLGLTSLDFAGI